MDKKIDFAVGGQAVIEGVMMRSPGFITVAVRKKTEGIKIKENPFKSVSEKFRFLKLPILRGIVNLIEMMIVGVRALNFSAQEFSDDMDMDDRLKDKEKAKQKPEDSSPQVSEAKNRDLFNLITFVFSFIVSIFLAIFLFKFIPLAITEFLRSKFPYIAEHYIIFNLIDGLLRLAIFIGYIAIISLWKDFRRLFEYHGAEHKSIYTYEKGLPLTVENAKEQSRFHPRCGTSFIIVVFLISIVIYTFVPRNPIFWQNLAQRIAVLPLIAGVGYEILKWSARNIKHIIVRIMIAPGLWSQRLTTKEPDDAQLEVALKALSRALELEAAKS